MEDSRKERSDKAGFTLVELVVVIAILGILAGIGAVAYGGYIEYTQKGLDRDSVGEIMHAVEVADYANPDLFGENGGAMMVLSKEKGLEASGGLEGSDIEAALNDALGEASSMKLKYDKWNGTADMSVFASLPTGDNSNIQKYLNDDNKGVASFADKIGEVWNDVQTVFENFDVDGSGSQMSKAIDHSLKHAEDIPNP